VDCGDDSLLLGGDPDRLDEAAGRSFPPRTLQRLIRVAYAEFLPLHRIPILTNIRNAQSTELLSDNTVALGIQSRHQRVMLFR
jgi:hypothetical protein